MFPFSIPVTKGHFLTSRQLSCFNSCQHFQPFYFLHCPCVPFAHNLTFLFANNTGAADRLRLEGDASIIHIIMEETLKPRRKKFPWQWVLLSVAVILFVVWLTLTPKGLLGKADAVGYAVCHQIEARAFRIGDRPFPFCARCTGMFLGAVLGLVFQISQGRKGRMPPTPAMILFGLLALAWVLDGVNSFMMLVPVISPVYETTSLTRLVTGTGMGLAVSALLLPSFIQTMFDKWIAKPALGNWKQILGVLLCAAALDGLIFMEIPWIMYPLALIGAAGVLVLLTMVYSMVWVMIFNRDNTFTRFRELIVPILAGFITAMIQVGAIDLARYLWTGTWGGFSL